MQRFSDDELENAIRVQWQADSVAGLHWPRCGQPGALCVPPQFTSWLLMARAGMPVELIAYLSYVEPREITRGAFVAWAMRRIWPPYATRFDDMLQRVPRYTARRPVLACGHKGAACVVRG